MARIKGSPKTGGRMKGTPNKKSVDIQQQLEDLGCNPIEQMALLAKKAQEEGDNALAGQMLKELAQYVAPKRKSVEMTNDVTVDLPAIEVIFGHDKTDPSST